MFKLAVLRLLALCVVVSSRSSLLRCSGIMFSRLNHTLVSPGKLPSDRRDGTPLQALWRFYEPALSRGPHLLQVS